MRSIGIIGAGVAGLSCAQALESQGISCALFDKGKRPGGRMSSLVLDGMAWDFGAQYLFSRSDDFAQQIADWRDSGLVAPWRDGPKGAFVGVPSMEELVAAQCKGRDVRFQALSNRIVFSGEEWRLSGPDFEAGPFDAIIVAVPPEQALPFVSLHDFSMACRLVNVRSTPCWTAMMAFPGPILSPTSHSELASYCRDLGPIAWAARNNSKPGRPDTECWVLQANADWSAKHIDMTREEAAAALFAIFADEVGAELSTPTFLKAHRWRFSVASSTNVGPLWNDAIGLGVCGDWSVAPTIEGAWLSGRQLADRIVQHRTLTATSNDQCAKA